MVNNVDHLYYLRLKVDFIVAGTTYPRIFKLVSAVMITAKFLSLSKHNESMLTLLNTYRAYSSGHHL